jgi:hypothetical protein
MKMKIVVAAQPYFDFLDSEDPDVGEGIRLCTNER